VSTTADMPLFNRPDTLFGVCEGIGREFGFAPNILRIALAVAMIWNPIAVIATYVGLGIALVISRLVVPVRRARMQPTEVPAAPAQEEEQAQSVAMAA